MVTRFGGVSMSFELEEYTESIQLLYYEDENLFRDAAFGNIIYNIYEFITPSDLYLFRHDSKYYCFPMVGFRNIMCEIIVIPDETCGERYESGEDIGDDYERIDRYQRSRRGS